jgi:hypothetical protein
MGDCYLSVDTEVSLEPEQEPTDYVLPCTGIIYYIRERDDRVFRVGHLLAWRIQPASGHGGRARSRPPWR